MTCLVVFIGILVACVCMSFMPTNNVCIRNFCSCFLPLNKTKPFVIFTGVTWITQPLCSSHCLWFLLARVRSWMHSAGWSLQDLCNLYADFCAQKRSSDPQGSNFMNVCKTKTVLWMHLPSPLPSSPICVLTKQVNNKK